MFRRPRLDSRRQAAERRGVGVKYRRHLLGRSRMSMPRSAAPRVDLVVDVGDVADISDMIRRHNDGARALKQQIEDDQHPAVADMEMIVDGRAAG